MYGSSILSSFELAKGYSKPIEGIVHHVSDDVVNAYQDIQARRKLSRILKSKSNQEPNLKIGDMVQLFQRGKNGKRGEWSSPKKIIKIDQDGRNVFVPGKLGKTVCAAFEDVRLAIEENEFSKIVSDALDALDNEIEHEIDNNIVIKDDWVNMESTNTVEDFDFTINEDDMVPTIGDNVEIYWPLDEQYYPGVIGNINDGKYTVNYDDGEVEILDIQEEIWKYQEGTDHSINSNNLRITSNEQEILRSMQTAFGNKSFLKYQCQGFELHPLYNAYQKEEEQFLDIIQVVPIELVPENANIVNSHVLYKLKSNDDKTIALKARIAPHGNEDKEKEKLTTDCQTCPPSGIRIVLSLSSLKGWKTIRIDAKRAFLKTGRATREVYVIPPTESKMRSTHRWLLLVAAYGLVNSGAKWQHQSDDVLFSMGLLQSKYIPQLFYSFNNQGEIQMLLAKIVDDIILTGEEGITAKFIDDFNRVFELGSVVSGPGEMRFFGTNLLQKDDMSVEIDVDDKLSNVFEYSFLRQRRKQMEEQVNDLEKKSFMSVNSTLGWIGSACSPLCSYYSSYIQQKLPDIRVRHVVEQKNILRKLQKQGSTIYYARPPLNTEL